MTYEEIRKKAIEEIDELGIPMTESEREKMIFGFCTGFIQGEYYQLDRRLTQNAELYTGIIKHLES